MAHKPSTRIIDSKTLLLGLCEVDQDGQPVRQLGPDGQRIEVVKRYPNEAHLTSEILVGEVGVSASALKEIKTQQVNGIDMPIKQEKQCAAPTSVVKHEPCDTNLLAGNLPNGCNISGKSSENKVFFCCDTCDKKFDQRQQYLDHCNSHLKCTFAGCTFAAVKRVMMKHYFNVHAHDNLVDGTTCTAQSQVNIAPKWGHFKTEPTVVGVKQEPASTSSWCDDSASQAIASSLNSRSNGSVSVKREPSTVVTAMAATDSTDLSSKQPGSSYGSDAPSAMDVQQSAMQHPSTCKRPRLHETETSIMPQSWLHQPDDNKAGEKVKNLLQRRHAMIQQPSKPFWDVEVVRERNMLLESINYVLHNRYFLDDTVLTERERLTLGALKPLRLAVKQQPANTPIADVKPAIAKTESQFHTVPSVAREFVESVPDDSPVQTAQQAPQLVIFDQVAQPVITNFIEAKTEIQDRGHSKYSQNTLECKPKDDLDCYDAADAILREHDDD